MRVLAQRAGRRRRSRPRPGSPPPAAWPRPRGRPAIVRSASVEEVADPAHRVRVRARILEDHRDPVGAVAAQLARPISSTGGRRRRSRRSPPRPPAAAARSPARSSTCPSPTRRPAPPPRRPGSEATRRGSPAAARRRCGAPRGGPRHRAAGRTRRHRREQTAAPVARGSDAASKRAVGGDGDRLRMADGLAADAASTAGSPDRANASRAAGSPPRRTPRAADVECPATIIGGAETAVHASDPDRAAAAAAGRGSAPGRARPSSRPPRSGGRRPRP